MPARGRRRGRASATGRSGSSATNWSVGLRQLARLARRRGASCARARAAAPTSLIVGYPGHLDLPAAQRVARGRPVVFDPLVSLYDTLVTDRGRFRRGGPAASVLQRRRPPRLRRRGPRRRGHRAARARSSASVRASRRSGRGLPGRRRGPALPPRRQPPAPFHALFVGKLIPLHGLETILAAAALAPEIPFRIVGSGQLEQLLDGAARERHLGAVDRVRGAAWRAPAGRLRARGLRHGREGGERDPEQGLPGARLRHAAVTADTPAARELLTDGKDALLVPAGDAAALADAVRSARTRHRARRARSGGGPRDLRGARERGRARRTLARRCSSSVTAAMSVTRPRAAARGSRPPPSPPASPRSRHCQHRAFWTGRFDLGNLTQAVWSTAHGDFLAGHEPSTDSRSRGSGPTSTRSSRLSRRSGGCGPTRRCCSSPRRSAVALGALPVFLLARKHLGERVGRARLRTRLPPLPADPVARRSTTSTPSRFATPLLLAAIWFLDEERLVAFAVAAGLACLTKEQVGLTRRRARNLVRGRHGRRRAGAVDRRQPGPPRRSWRS